MDPVTREDIFAFAEEEYGVTPEYLWAKYPNYAILRHNSNSKWFAAVMDVPAAKLGLAGDRVLEILDIKCDPITLGSLLGMPGYLPGYHMNKSNWITVLLDGSVPKEQVFSLLDLSYDLTKGKLKKKKGE